MSIPTDLFKSAAMAMGPRPPTVPMDLDIQCKLCSSDFHYPLTPESVDPVNDAAGFNQAATRNYQDGMGRFFAEHLEKTHPEEAAEIKEVVKRVSFKDLLKNISPMKASSFNSKDGKDYVRFTCIYCLHYLEWEVPKDDVEAFIDGCHVRFLRKHIASNHPNEFKEIDRRARNAALYITLKRAQKLLSMKEVERE